MEVSFTRKISEKLTMPFWLVILRLCTDALYTIVIQPMYAYYGFRNDFSLTRYILSWFFLLPVFWIIRRWKNREDVSCKIVTILMFFGYMPACLLYAYMDAPFIGLLIAYYAVLVISVDLLAPIRVTGKYIGKDAGYYLLLLFVAVLVLNELYIWAAYTHFHIQLDLYNVYDVRSESKTYSMPLLMYYIHAWARTLTPFIALYFLHNKKRLIFSGLLVLQFITFSIDASKSVFFSMVVSLGLYFLLKKGKSFIHYIPFGLSCISIAGLLERILAGSAVITNYFIRRMMFFPALLNYQYAEYFSIHGFDYYRRSIGGLFSKSIYTQDMADIIGQVYYGHEMHANNGLFADAYANLGWIGVLLMPFLLALVLKVLDGSTSKVSPLAAQALVIAYGFSLMSSSFFTIMLTHGLGIVCIIAYFTQDSPDLQGQGDIPETIPDMRQQSILGAK